MKTGYKWFNEASEAFMRNKDSYLQPKHVHVADRVIEIGKRAEEILGEKGFAEEFEKYMSRGYYSLSTPVWTNFGTNRGLGISCFNSYIEDSMESILYTAAEVGMMSKLGGGTSAYFGKLRPRGAEIKNNGKSSGSVHFMQLFDSITNLVSQGSQRRGSFAAYLDIHHPDIEEFLKIRTEGFPIQDISFGVCVPDWWLKDMKDGDKEKRRIWARVIQLRGETGYPYIFFTDNVNNNTVDVYKDKNMKIHASNLCVTGDTLILTRDGNVPIKNLDGKFTDVWNGEYWSRAKIQKTGENQRFYKVELDNGTVIYATEYHKWYSWDRMMYRTRDLYEGLSLEPYVTPEGKLVEVKVKSVSLSERIEDSYCAHEPKRNKIVLNGILTGNCSEIALPTNEDESFVCDLSSINLLYWDEIKQNPRVVHVLVRLLDAVMTDFIEKASKIKFMERAVNFARRHRALGIGVLGWHSYLQSKMIPFESIRAKNLTNEIFKFLKEETYAESKRLAQEFGEPEVLKGYGRRNTTLLAIAPTTSSAFILGQVSQSIEPYMSNYYVKDVAKGKFTIKNPYLKEILAQKGKDDYDTWDSILKNGGSVQHLDFLTKEEKDVFKTFDEISQKEIIIQASIRQKYIDQAQSLNLMIHPDTPAKDINELLLFAHESGIKTLYYQHSINSAKEFSRELLNCVNCE